jgi:hypothetical protein
MRKLLSAVIIISAAIVCFSQKPAHVPDLSGTWKLKKVSKNTSTGSTARRERGDVLVITQTDIDIKFLGKSSTNGVDATNEVKFFLDGRSEENTRANATKPSETSTKWKDDRLLIVEVVPVTFRSAAYGVKQRNLEIIEEWTLSKNGKQLTQKLSDNWFRIDPMAGSAGGTPAYPMTVTRTYERGN